MEAPWLNPRVSKTICGEMSLDSHVQLKWFRRSHQIIESGVDVGATFGLVWACHQIIFLKSGPLTLKLRRERSISLCNFWNMRGAIIGVGVFLTNDRMLRYKYINTHFFMDLFLVTAKAVSEWKSTCMQLFVSDTGFMYVYPMELKSEIPMAVKVFTKEIGVYESRWFLIPKELRSPTSLTLSWENGMYIEVLDKENAVGEPCRKVYRIV